MTNVAHTATITAYETKDGTFTAVCKNQETGNIVRQPGFETLEEATYAAQMMAWEIAPCTFAKVKKGNDYYANAWASA
jgi:hypothetical protein